MAVRHIPAGRWPHLDVGDQDPEINRIYRKLAICPWISMTALRPRDDLSLIACFALDAHTGELKRYFQFTPHHNYGYDATETSISYLC